MKERLWAVTDRIPIVREVADPVVFALMVVIVVLAAAGFAFASDLIPGDEHARDHVLQMAGGLLIVFGAYYTSITIRERRAEQRFERQCRLIELLGEPSSAVRVGAIRMLESMAFEKPALPRDSITAATSRARGKAVLEALEQVEREDRPPTSELAATVRRELIENGYPWVEDR